MSLVSPRFIFMSVIVMVAMRFVISARIRGFAVVSVMLSMRLFVLLIFFVLFVFLGLLSLFQLVDHVLNLLHLKRVIYHVFSLLELLLTNVD